MTSRAWWLLGLLSACGAPPATWESPSLGTMRLVPAGTFTMGCKPGRDDLFSACYSDESPAHEVKLTRPIYVMEHEVTQAAWASVMGANLSAFQACGGSCPVDNVSWEDAREFLARVSARDGVTYRLPTEAEWEWAARGGEDFAYAGGAGEGVVAWVRESAGGSTHEVCGKRRNGFGLCDMTGNVAEWVEDGAGDYAAAAVTDPRGPATASLRVVRGGAWSSDAYSARVASRSWGQPGARDHLIGFRVVRDAP
jgi:formylglycine-generating enzyme required for sulfatase activity